MTEKRVWVEITIRIFRIEMDNMDVLPFYNVCVFVYLCEHVYWGSHINVSMQVFC